MNVLEEWMVTNLRELHTLPQGYELFFGDLVLIDGVVHAWDGERWVRKL